MHTTQNGKIFILSKKLNKLEVRNDQLSAVSEISLPIIQSLHNGGSCNLSVIDNNAVISLPSYLLLVISKGNIIRRDIGVKDGHCYFRTYNNNLLAIVPFKKIVNLDICEGYPIVKWELDLRDNSDLDAYLHYRFESKDHFL